MKFGSLFKQKAWPSCKQPRTESFRAEDGIYKTLNSVFLNVVDVVETPESWFTNSSECPSFSTKSEESGFESSETLIRGLRSERFFVEPGETKSIMKEAKEAELPFVESFALAMDSEDPYVDFRASMEEMVEAHGLKDWDCLEDLLNWYLKVNGKKNHGYIVGAFMDLLVGLLSSPSEGCGKEEEDSSSSSSSSSSGEI